MTQPYIYFIQPIGGGLVKIGCSQRPHGRLVNLMAWSPFPLQILATAPGSFDIERRLHRQFKLHRAHGEWFRPAPDLMAFIEAVKASGSVGEIKAVVYHAHADLVTALGGPTPLSREVGCSASQAWNWMRRGIPWRWRNRVAMLANERGVGLPAGFLSPVMEAAA